MKEKLDARIAELEKEAAAFKAAAEKELAARLGGIAELKKLAAELGKAEEESHGQGT